jgi:hypothetical protein
VWANTLRGGWERGCFAELGEIPFFAAADEALGGALEFFPSGADFFGFLGGDPVIRCGGGDDGEEIGEFLDDLVRGWDEKMGVGPLGGWILDKESAGAFADPLDQAFVLGGIDECFDPVEGVGGAAAVAIAGLGPFIDHGEGEVEVGGDLLDAAFGEHFTQQFVGIHRWSIIVCGGKKGRSELD